MFVVRYMWTSVDIHCVTIYEPKISAHLLRLSVGPTGAWQPHTDGTNSINCLEYEIQFRNISYQNQLFWKLFFSEYFSASTIKKIHFRKGDSHIETKTTTKKKGFALYMYLAGQ